MGPKMIGFLAIISLLTIVGAQYNGFQDIPGDFCRTAGIRESSRCCSGRDDPCAVPIEGTLCYCDHFCNRTANSDCCPDYWDVCLGMDRYFRKDQNCKHNGVEILSSKSAKFNCNVCSCDKGTLSCQTNPCLIENDLLISVDGNGGWTAKNYSFMWGRSLDEGLELLTGTFAPKRNTEKMYPIKLHYDVNEIPRDFDARKKWPNLAGISDQGWCGSSWAFSTISVAQDRLTIGSSGRENVDWSEQNLISCNIKGQQACKGGYVVRAWSYMRKFGVVTDECYPYKSGDDGAKGQCNVDKHASLQSVDCRTKEFPMQRTDLYTTQPAYRIASNEHDIMWELMTNGPVQALMRVYPDFFLYSRGIYYKTRMTPKYDGKSSVHSVKLVGWGEAFDAAGSLVKYWLAANSWGTKWGEDGMFKIRRGTNESDIEIFILAVRSRLSEEANLITTLRKRRISRSHHKRKY